MSRRAERERTFRNIVRLRRAERAAPGSRDVVSVRADLERQLGESVSRAFAAHLLGISHTALNKWIATGDVPTVLTASGREEVPLLALVDLYEAVLAARAEGRSHALEPVMQKGRARAEELQPRRLVTVTDTAERHRRAQLRNLAFHRAISKRLKRSMVDEALHLVWKWRESGRIDGRYADRWEAILSRPLPEVRAMITADTPEADDLRQNSPFAGQLSEPERRKLIRELS